MLIASCLSVLIYTNVNVSSSCNMWMCPCSLEHMNYQWVNCISSYFFFKLLFATTKVPIPIKCAMISVIPGANDSFLMDLSPHTLKLHSAELNSTLVWATGNTHLVLKITTIFYRQNIAQAFGMEIGTGNNASFIAQCKCHLNSLVI